MEPWLPAFVISYKNIKNILKYHLNYVIMSITSEDPAFAKYSLYVF